MPREKRNFRNYQRASMLQAFTNIKAGENTAFIGVGSVGKSNFLRAMRDQAVVEQYLEEKNPTKYIMVYVDSHLIQHDGELMEKAGPVFAGYELLIVSLLETLKEMDREEAWLYPADSEDREIMLKYLEEDYFNLRTNKNGDSYAGLRYFRNICDMFVGKYEDLHLIFLIDEIERLIKYMPAYFFEQLRGIRDKFKYQLMFVTTSRYLMEELQLSYETFEEQEIVEGFTDLLKGTEYALNRLDEAMARANIERYCKRYNYRPLPESLINLLWRASGGHSGLLRHSFQPSIYYPIQSNLGFEDQLRQFCHFLVTYPHDTGVYNECHTIFKSLTVEEQTTATGKIQPDSPLFKPMVNSLQKKQLIYEENGTTRWLPLFQAYLSVYHYPQPRE